MFFMHKKEYKKKKIWYWRIDIIVILAIISINKQYNFCIKNVSSEIWRASKLISMKSQQVQEIIIFLKLYFGVDIIRFILGQGS